MPKVPVIGYVRVSRVGGREGDSFISPDEQRRSIERVAEREGLRVVRIIEELDKSGGDAPGLAGTRRFRKSRAAESEESPAGI